MKMRGCKFLALSFWLLALVGCTPGHHINLMNAPICTRVGYWSADDDYYKGAIVCFGGKPYRASQHSHGIDPTHREFWKLY